MTPQPPVVTILTEKQHKLDKGLRLKWATFGIQLSPANSAKLGTVCAMSGICGLIDCLADTGHNAMPTAKRARYRRTLLFKKFTGQFFAQAQAEITLWQIRQQAQGLKLAARPNVLSDLPTMAHELARHFPAIQFYDYTKLARPAARRLPNYHLTYSYSERTTPADIQHCIDHRVNIATVFAVKKDERLPKFVTLHGRTFPVIDGDKTDLRFLDPSDRTYVVGLRWKVSKNSQVKLARAIKAGYVIDVAPILVADRAAA